MIRRKRKTKLKRKQGRKGEQSRKKENKAENENKDNRNKVVFLDIPDDHWAKDEIEVAVRNRIITGKVMAYSPDEPVARQEISVMLDRAFAADRGVSLLASRGISLHISGAGITAANGNGTTTRYVDVSRETCSWSYDSIIRMSQLGVFTDLPGDKFNPGGKVSRAEMTVFLCNIFEK